VPDFEFTMGGDWILTVRAALPGGMRVEDAFKVTVVPGEMAGVVNPIAQTAESLARGEQVYRDHCPMCHGDAGRGDGPAAFGMNPRPADFRVHMAAGHTDGELFYWVSEGLRGTMMPAFREVLSEDERWHVVNFIRTFAPPDSAY
jgi:mono/diheme cytochrome c family protein